jgi:uncharacterized protein (DUF302 family)
MEANSKLQKISIFVSTYLYNLFVMAYYLSKMINLAFPDAVEKVTVELQKEGFGVITQIDVRETLKNKLDVDFRPYLILGACNPQYAHQALNVDDKIGTLLPCNFVVQEVEGGSEVLAMNPHETMSKLMEGEMMEISRTITEKVNRVLAQL